jgi:hypothetical protein
LVFAFKEMDRIPNVLSLTGEGNLRILSLGNEKNDFLVFLLRRM